MSDPHQALASRCQLHLPPEIPQRVDRHLVADHHIALVNRFEAEHILKCRLQQGGNIPRPGFRFRCHLSVRFRQRMDGIQRAARGQDINVQTLARFQILQGVGDLAAIRSLSRSMRITVGRKGAPPVKRKKVIGRDLPST